MKRDEIIQRLKASEAELRQLGVRSLYLFGSATRDEAREDSDVDLFFDYDEGRFGLFELMDVKERAAAILGCRTDIMSRDSIHPVIKQRIVASALRVF